METTISLCETKVARPPSRDRRRTTPPRPPTMRPREVSPVPSGHAADGIVQEGMQEHPGHGTGHERSIGTRARRVTHDCVRRRTPLPSVTRRTIGTRRILTIAAMMMTRRRIATTTTTTTRAPTPSPPSCLLVGGGRGPPPRPHPGGFSMALSLWGLRWMNGGDFVLFTPHGWRAIRAWEGWVWDSFMTLF